MFGLLRKKSTHPMIIEIEVCIEDDDPGYHAYCPALKGLHTWGATKEAARENVISAVQAYMISLSKHGDPLPVGIIKRHHRPTTQTENCVSENIRLAYA